MVVNSCDQVVARYNIDLDMDTDLFRNILHVVPPSLAVGFICDIPGVHGVYQSSMLPMNQNMFLFVCFGRPLKVINHLAYENQIGSLA
jgi:hypothetical protein